jgi:hypothetical protein
MAITKTATITPRTLLTVTETAAETHCMVSAVTDIESSHAGSLCSNPRLPFTVASFKTRQLKTIAILL